MPAPTARKAAKSGIVALAVVLAGCASGQQSTTSAAPSPRPGSIAALIDCLQNSDLKVERRDTDLIAAIRQGEGLSTVHLFPNGAAVDEYVHPLIIPYDRVGNRVLLPKGGSPEMRIEILACMRANMPPNERP